MIVLSPRWRAAGLLVFCLAVYNANLRTIGSYDSLAASTIPFQIWWGHGLNLDRFATVPANIGYSMVRSRSGHIVSAYPIVTPLLVTPLYAPLRLLPHFDADRMSERARLLAEKVAASIVAALSVAIFYLTLRRIAREKVALGMALVYAFATATWVISSQALWQHGAAELFLTGALYLLLDPRPAGWRAAGLGLLGGLLTANRPQDVFFAVAIALIVLRRSRRAAWPLVAAAGAMAVLLLVYNEHHFGNLLGGYPQIQIGQTHLPELFHRPYFDEIAALLVSNRGLLFFCPFFLALVAVRGSALASAAFDRWALGGAVVALIVFMSCVPSLSAGICYGPRYTADALPILCLLLADAWERMRRPARALFLAAVGYAVGLQIIGAFYYPAGNVRAKGTIWQIDPSQPVVSWRHGPASPHYLILLAPGKVCAPLPPPHQQGEVRWVAAPPAVAWPATATLPIEVAVTNGGPARWTSFGGNYGRWAVRLLVDWQPLQGPAKQLGPAPFLTDFWLRWRLRPHETTTRRLEVTAPPLPGTYRLTVEPAQPTGATWARFSHAGAVPAAAIVTVTPRGSIVRW
jgi:hypothetical protein